MRTVTEDMFKLAATEQVAQRQRYNKTTRLKNHDTSEEIVCGRMPPGTCNRTRGFSVRYHKRIASESGASIRANVERRRTSDNTYQMTAIHKHDATEPIPKRETCIDQMLDASKNARCYHQDTTSLFVRTGRSS